MLRGQISQLLVLAVLVGLASPFAPASDPARTWFVAALAVCALHHAWVSAFWRLELDRGAISRALGHPRGFHVFMAGFATLAIGRIATVWQLAAVDRGTLNVSPSVGWFAGGACLAVGVWLLASVHRYFGTARAMGLDHWEPERFRNEPFVRRGIHRLTPNAMYVFAPTLLLAAVFLWRSSAALAATFFNAAYLWTHYLCTEKPDLERIYGPTPRS